MPAPGPIEQRWTASSKAFMSPAYSENENEVFSWVGVIMYLPADVSEGQKKEIKDRFVEYTALLQPLCEEFQAVPHWAKIELGSPDTITVEKTLEVIDKRYDMRSFAYIREAVDPHGILMNSRMELLLNWK